MPTVIRRQTNTIQTRGTIQRSISGALLELHHLPRPLLLPRNRIFGSKTGRVIYEARICRASVSDAIPGAAFHRNALQFRVNRGYNYPSLRSEEHTSELQSPMY